MNQKLKIFSGNDTITYRTSSRTSRKQEVEAFFEKKWQTDPESFNPLRSVDQKERVEKTWEFIQRNISLQNSFTVDLGSGYGYLSKKCAKEGAKVTSVDIAEEAIKQVQNFENITPSKQWIPHTSLEDNHFDLVLSTDLIGYLPQEDLRLYFSELARLVKKEGYVIASSPLDVYTESPLAYLLQLAETELEIVKILKTYNSLWIRKYLFLKKWRLFKPFVYFMDRSTTFLRLMEKLTEFFYQEDGISHVVILAKRKSLLKPLPENEQPVFRKPKKSVWE